MFVGEQTYISTENGEKSGVISGRYSPAINRRGTNLARQSLTSVIGRELVFSLWFDRRPGNEGKID